MTAAMSARTAAHLFRKTTAHSTMLLTAQRGAARHRRGGRARGPPRLAGGCHPHRDGTTVIGKGPGMTDAHAASSTGRFEVRVTADSHFSWVRTRLSVERTMMSWQRTAVALIGFGFAIVQYLEHLGQASG